MTVYKYNHTFMINGLLIKGQDQSVGNEQSF